MINEYEAIGVMRVSRGNEVLGGNLSHCYFVHHKSHITHLGI
jgi:hypothetical protein